MKCLISKLETKDKSKIKGDLLKMETKIIIIHYFQVKTPLIMGK
jgi:hypothetical protein